MSTSPEPKPPIESQLQSYGKGLEQLLDGEASPPTSRRGALVVFAVLCVALCGAVAAVVFRGESSDTSIGPSQQTTVPSSIAPATSVAVATTTTLPLEERLDPDELVALDACYQAAEIQAERRGDFGRDLFPDLPDKNVAEIAVVHDATGEYVRGLFVLTNPSKLDCAFDADGAVENVDRGSVRTPIPTPASDELYVVNMGSASETQGGVRATELDVWGVAGVDVVGVEALGEGAERLQALVEDGWFFASGPIGEVDVADDPLKRILRIENQVFRWTLTDGTVREGTYSELRVPRPVDQCVATPGCFEDEYAELLAAAEALDNPAQAEALRSGEVTEQHLIQAKADYVDCLAGDWSGQLVNNDFLTNDPLMPTIANLQENDAECGPNHNTLIIDAYALQLARQRAEAQAESGSPAPFNFPSAGNLGIETVIIADDPESTELPLVSQTIDESACNDVWTSSLETHIFAALQVGDHEVCFRTDTAPDGYTDLTIDGKLHTRWSSETSISDECQRRYGLSVNVGSFGFSPNEFFIYGEAPTEATAVAIGPPASRQLSAVSVAGGETGFYAAIVDERTSEALPVMTQAGYDQWSFVATAADCGS